MSAEESKKPQKEENGDPYWSRILIFTIIVVWVALVAGNWVGHYMVKAGIFAKKTSADGNEFRIMPPSKPMPWKQPAKPANPSGDKGSEETPVKVDENSDISKPEETAAPEPSPDSTAKKLQTKPAPEKTEEPVDVSSPAPEPSEKPTVKPAVKPAPKPAPTPAEAPSPKPAAPAAKPTPKPEVKPSPKPEVKPSPKPAPAPKPTQASKPAVKPDEPASENGSYSIQVGNYKENKYAQEMAEQLRSKGYEPIITKTGDTFKVVVGNYRDKKKAQDTEAKIKGDGIDAFIINER
ncbi:MAG: SPOR domain-containing protein [Firmicutes bacterium]|nr:SPOR domain-containing protein [Bacillota bacterium]